MMLLSHWKQLAKEVVARAAPRRLLVVRESRRHHNVWLTFDDGPHPEHTPALLDILREQKIQATFFVVGSRAAEHPDLLRRMKTEGHTVGHHSYFHRRPGKVSPADLAEEIQQTQSLLQSVLGEKARFFRPPLGVITPGKLLRMWLAGQTVVLWNVEPRDDRTPDVAQLTGWFNGRPLQGGDVILLHDTEPQTVAALPAILSHVRKAGLGFARFTS